MIEFAKPNQLNGEQLVNELVVAGITVVEPPMIDGNGKFWLGINQSDVAKATPIVALHIGIDMGAVEQAKIATLKAAAKANLIAGTPMTAEQAATLFL